jgi:hypothetical protein
MDLGLNSLSTDRLPRAVLARFNEVKGMLRVAVRGKVGSMVGLLVRVQCSSTSMFAESKGPVAHTPKTKFAYRRRD